MCNLQKNKVISGHLWEKCDNIIIKMDYFKTAKSKGWFDSLIYMGCWQNASCQILSLLPPI